MCSTGKYQELVKSEYIFINCFSSHWSSSLYGSWRWFLHEIIFRFLLQFIRELYCTGKLKFHFFCVDFVVHTNTDIFFWCALHTKYEYRRLFISLIQIKLFSWRSHLEMNRYSKVFLWLFVRILFSIYCSKHSNWNIFSFLLVLLCS